MPDQQSFEHRVLEADLKQLAAEIRNQRERPELKNAGEQELVKEAIRAFPQLEKRSSAGAASSPPSAPQPSSAPSSNSPLPSYAQDASAAVKLEIEYLLDTALHYGLGKALAEASKSPYFVQDAFHDALAGKLYLELQKRGMVK